MRSIVAIALIVLGLAGLLYGGFSYTRTEEVVDLGPLEVNKQTRETVPLPPILGGILLATGVGLLFVGRGQHV